ncbi:MAG: lactate racemase domain-containing protein [Candidatus Pacebacteria bacterium]|nr:lactate racemase domain-containing protein [Candidatus Paceibacterota bacterium]
MLKLARRFAHEARDRICAHPQRVLLLPPDITRAHSGAGWITEELYKFFAGTSEVRVIPTLGQHVPHTPEQNLRMFGSIPQDRFENHDWRAGTRTIGEIPESFVTEVSSGQAGRPIPISLNTSLLDGNWDLILNIGHVVPHEVLGFANHNKNYFIGLGGKATICASHMMAACCGIENNLGHLITPLRACYNLAEHKYLSDLPDAYLRLIRKYGYCGTEKIMRLWRESPSGSDLKDLTHGTAHLIHSSSEGRFTITYAPGGMSEDDIRTVNFDYMDLDEALRRYNPLRMKNGFNTMPDGEEVYFIATPSAGLWATEEKLRRKH